MSDEEKEGTGEDSAASPQLVSQRSENSVLFSLSNLTAVEDQTGRAPGFAASAGASGGDKSGLIDLGTLAKLGAGGTAAPGESADPNASVPALFNVGSRRSNKGLIIGIVVLVVVLLGLGGVAVFLLTQKPKEEPVAAKEEKEPVEDDGVETIAATQQLNPTVIPDDDRVLPPKENPTDPAAANGTEPKDAPKDDKPKTDKPKTDKPKEDKPKEDKPVEDKPKSSAPPLSKDDVVSVMDGSLARVKKCDKGVEVKVSFKIETSGKVSGAQVTGGGASNATANCVLTVVRKLKFPAHAGPAKSVTWPYKL